jgi:hypothetical protein
MKTQLLEAQSVVSSRLSVVQLKFGNGQQTTDRSQPAFGKKIFQES